MSAVCSGWISIIDQLPQIHARLQRVQVECADFRFIIDTYDTPETLFYFDPPYIMDTRKSGGYRHEIVDADHIELIEKLKSIKGAAILSGYDHEMYESLEWNKLTFDQACFSEGRTRTRCKGKTAQRRTECLWLHPRVTQTESPLFA
jgi:DNA adenine methylase